MLVELGIPILSAIFQTLRKYSGGLPASLFETTLVTQVSLTCLTSWIGHYFLCVGSVND